jgi:hypothetical protein
VEIGCFGVKMVKIWQETAVFGPFLTHLGVGKFFVSRGCAGKAFVISGRF